MRFKTRWRAWALGVTLAGLALGALAGEAQAWLRQLHEATQSQSYEGTMVISVDEQMATAQVMHTVREGVSVDRIEVLTGEPRTTYRHGADVVTVWPAQQVWVKEQRHDLGLFPALIGDTRLSLDDWYEMRRLPDDRVAGRVAQVMALEPKDDARWGYRIWRDVQSGLMLKLQTMSPDGSLVLEQTAFTSLGFQAGWRDEEWVKALPAPPGMQARTVQTRAVNPGEWGLSLQLPNMGFVLQRAQLPLEQAKPDDQHPVQWVFSDGLATVSVFYQPLRNPSNQATPEQVIRMGATHTLVRQTPTMRVTVVGEAPLATLRTFAEALKLEKNTDKD